MDPCEQCVYIRYSFIVIAFGGIIASIKPSNTVLKNIGYILILYGTIRGIMFSSKLNNIHHAIHTSNPFGIQGCLVVPHFDFGLPLHIWFPTLFNPTGSCGIDIPNIQENITLHRFQKKIIELYSNGWYLIPNIEFGNMAQCCLFIYIIYLIILTGICISQINNKMNTKFNNKKFTLSF